VLFLHYSQFLNWQNQQITTMKKHYFSTFIKYFFQGILIIGPLSATIWIIWSIFKSVDNLVPDLSKDYPGLVFALVLLGTAIIGFIGSRLILGKLLVGLLDYLVAHIPGVKIIYSSIKDVLSSFVGDKRKFSNPVWVRVNETPEVWRIGFLTQPSMDFVNLEGMVSVYLPHSYAISGWVIVTSSENVKPAEGFTAQKAMEFALSGGITTIKKG
jgi:hypothetical protein